MFRMGRNPKSEQAENETPETNAHAASAPTTNAPASVKSQSAPTPAPVVAEATTPERPAVERTAATHSRAVTEAESLAREIKEGVMSGFIGGSTMLTGDAAFKGMLRIDGHLSGNISSDKGTLIVSSGGQVDANIEVAVARINGTVNGDITASERIEMGRTARVNGNIQTPALVIESGALFEGACRMSQPLPHTRKPEADSNVRTSTTTTAANAPAASRTTTTTAPAARNASARLEPSRA